MIKVGETAILKTSNEEVFVLKIQSQDEGDDMVTVRRPTGTSDGVKHLLEEFYSMELETKDARLERELAERNMLRKKMGLGDEEFAPGQIVERPN